MRFTRFALLSICAVGALLFFHSLALADAGASDPATQPITVNAMWPMIGMVVSLAWGYLSRKLTDPSEDGLLGGFFHKALGHLAIAFGGALVGAAAPVIQHWGVTGYSGTALAWALLGAATSFFAALNPSLPQATGKLQALLLPLVFVGMLSGCAFGKALGACELGKLPVTSEIVIAELATIAADTSKTPQDLLQAAEALAPGQGQCFLIALEAWAQSSGKAGMLGKIRGAKALSKGGACRELPYGGVSEARIRALVSEAVRVELYKPALPTAGSSTIDLTNILGANSTTNVDFLKPCPPKPRAQLKPADFCLENN